jgi:hypothetical protein
VVLFLSPPSNKCTHVVWVTGNLPSSLQLAEQGLGPAPQLQAGPVASYLRIQIPTHPHPAFILTGIFILSLLHWVCFYMPSFAGFNLMTLGAEPCHSLILQIHITKVNNFYSQGRLVVHPATSARGKQRLCLQTKNLQSYKCTLSNTL